MALPNMAQQTASLNQSLQGVTSNAHAAGAEMEHLSKSVFSYTKTIMSVGIGVVLKDIAESIWEQHKAQRQIIADGRERLLQGQGALSSMKDELKHMTKAAGFTNNQRKQQREAIETQKFYNEHLESELTIREGIQKLLDKHPVWNKLEIGAVTVVASMYGKMLDSAHALNQALIKTDTSFETRLSLISRVLTVQQELGASTEAAAEATRALVEYGGNLNAGFQQNLKAVIMMRNGLGIAASTGAELVTIFSRQLHTSAEAVGNVMADVAAQTGLAAEKAAQFAIEVGRALRLLGPTFRTDAAGVTKVIAGLAGRVQELGGNAQLVVNIFKRMSGGTAEAFFMRGLAGGATPGQLGTAGGTEAALRALSQRISSILTAPEGSPMYVAQLQAVAEMSQMAAEDVVDFQQAIRSLDTPLTEGQRLAKAYRDQTKLVGDSFKQMKESLAAMTTEALLPTLQVLQPVVAGLADFTKWLSGAKCLIGALTYVLPAAGGVALFFLSRLGSQILTLAAQAKISSEILGKTSLGPLARDLVKLNNLPGTLLKGGSWAAAGVSGSIAALAAAGAAGWGIGRALDRIFPENGIAKIARDLADWKHDWKSQNAPQSRVSMTDLYSSIDQAADALKNYAQGYTSEKATQAAIDAAIAKNPANANVIRDMIGKQATEGLVTKIAVEHLTRGTVKTPEDLRRDKEQEQALLNLEMDKRFLLEQQKSTAAQSAMKDYLRSMDERQRTGEFWQLTPFQDASGRVSFMPRNQ